MTEYKFNYEDREYILNEKNCSELINDEEKPVKGITVEHILNMINATSLRLDVLITFNAGF